jgi:MFS family permease
MAGRAIRYTGAPKYFRRHLVLFMNHFRSSLSLRVFLTGHTANALNIGVQMVLVAWLAAGVLQLSPAGIAWVQAAVLAPNLALILFAGAMVDRHHPARILTFTNTALLLVHLAALGLLLAGSFDRTSLLLYALCLGSGNSFVQSAREKLVAQLDDQRLQQNISLAGVCQYLAQAVGIASASLMDYLGAYVIVGLQAGLCLLALACYARLVQLVPQVAPLSGPLAPAVGAALRRVWQQIALRHLILMVAFNGLMHLGMFLVLLPVLARDYMSFSSFEYAFLQLCFTLGSVLSFWVILQRGRVRYPGQAVLFCSLYTGMIALALAAGPTLYGLFGLIFLWGVVAGASANLSRLVLQTLVPDDFRGRAMSVYQLALFGMAPLGALLAGGLVQWYGVTFTFHVLAGSSFGLFAVSLLSRALWGVRQEEVHSPSAE